MKYLFLLLYLCSAGLPEGPVPDLALVGYVPPAQRAEVVVTHGPNPIGRHACDAAAGYVEAWHAYALITDNQLGAFDGRSYRKISDLGWIIKNEPDDGSSWVFAVSPDGKTLADYDERRSTLRIWSLTERKLRFTVSAKGLSRARMGVAPGNTYSLKIIFSPSGDFVFCSFPMDEQPDGGDIVRPITVKVALRTGSVSISGIGSPMGWIGGKLARIVPNDVYVGRSVKTMPQGGPYAANGRVVFGVFKGRSTVRIQVFGPDLAPISPSCKVVGLPAGFIVDDLLPYPSK